MTKPWTVVIAAASGLLMLGLVVNHFRGTNSETPGGSPQKLAQSVGARVNGERSGWSAREGSESPERAGIGGSRSGASAGSGLGAGNGAAGDREAAESDRGGGTWGETGGSAGQRR